MKTFETEKSNIPEGATHYCNEGKSGLFTWLKFGDSAQFWCDNLEAWRCIGSHVDRIMSRINPIPQTKEVEWANGDECVWGGIDAVFIGYSQSHKSRCAIEYLRDHCSVIDTVFIDELSKPETETERVERERLEAAYDLYLAFWSASKSSVILESFKEFSCSGNSDLKHFLAVVVKTGYRKD